MLKKREDFIAAMDSLDRSDAVFIDESGSDTVSCSDYGRTVGGDRLKSPKPAGRWERFSMIAAISIFGVVAMLYGPWATDGEIFMNFVKDFLIKKLRKGQIVFLDNARIHKNSIIKVLIESVGAKLVFLPPYSPDLSPIEKMWSKLKHFIKKLSPRTAGEFHDALVSALSELNDDDFEAWYDDCGYALCND